MNADEDDLAFFLPQGIADDGMVTSPTQERETASYFGSGPGVMPSHAAPGQADPRLYDARTHRGFQGAPGGVCDL